jgi:hypothetical protein
VKQITAIVLFILIAVSLKAQHPILKNLFIDDEFGGGVRISFTIGGGNTCNGIRIFHTLDSNAGFNQIGEIPGICGSSESDTRYSFVHDAPTDFDTNYYFLEFGGHGRSSVVEYFVFGEQSDIKWLIIGPEIRFYKPVNEEIIGVELYDFKGNAIALALETNDYWSYHMKRNSTESFFTLIRYKDGSTSSIKLSIIK